MRRGTPGHALVMRRSGSSPSGAVGQELAPASSAQADFGTDDRCIGSYCVPQGPRLRCGGGRTASGGPKTAAPERRTALETAGGGQGALAHQLTTFGAPALCAAHAPPHGPHSGAELSTAPEPNPLGDAAIFRSSRNFHYFASGYAFPEPSIRSAASTSPWNWSGESR
jgi:hypothetical protein